MGDPRTAIVVLNWNGKHFLERFLPDLVANTPEYAEIIIADNASDDGSVPFVHEKYPAIRVIQLDANHGYAGGYNRALREVDAEYVVLLNSDIRVTENWLEPCIAMMEEDHDVVAVQPKIRSLDQPDHFEYAGAAGGYLDKFGFPFCRGRIFQTVEKDQGQYDEAVDVFWASGAALFLRAYAFYKAGGFDERFFAHMEEVDLCWRLQNQGFRIRVCPRSVVFHLGGGSLPVSSPRKTYLNFRNSLWMLAKNLPRKRYFLLILFRSMLDELAAARFLFAGQWKNFLAVLKAWWSFARHHKSLRKHSRNVPEQLPAMIYRRSIVLDYFLFRKKYFSGLRFRAARARK